ncbi:MAG: hypothetical protein Q4C54_10460 [Clostridia bacterium]|nr:hypothetical protein [Clostridia bacterium]
MHPLGAVEIVINPKDYNEGDIVRAICSAGKLVSDSGDEATINAVAELKDYTYAIGGTDTVFYEWSCDNMPGDIVDAYRNEVYTRHSLGYQYVDEDEYGYTYRIIRPTGPSHGNGMLRFVFAWESNDKPYAYDIVSFLTC